MDKQEWIQKASARYKSNGLFEKNDNMISDVEATQWAELLLTETPELINVDPEKFADSQDVTGWFGQDDKDNNNDSN